MFTKVDFRHFFWITLALGACGDAATPQNETIATALDGKADSTARNFLATNCEIFIDKVQPLEQGEHGIEILGLYVKTLNSRLDGNVVEVGFRNKYASSNVDASHDWQNQIATRVANDYFSLDIDVFDDFTTQVDDAGAFYVRTSNNTTYWLKPNDDNKQNYHFDENAYLNAIENLDGKALNLDDDLSVAIPTQSAAMRYYNPQNCR